MTPTQTVTVSIEISREAWEAFDQQAKDESGGNVDAYDVLETIIGEHVGASLKTSVSIKAER